MVEKKMIENKSDSGIDESKGFGLTAYLSPFAVLALSFGYAVGWGAFVLPGTMFLPNAGPLGTLIGILIGTGIMSVLAFNYHLMTVRMKEAGGTSGFISTLFGHDHGFLVAWFLFLTYVAILWANATALVLLVRFLFGNAFQFGFYYNVLGFDIYFGEVLLSLIAITLCGLACIFSKRLAIRLHTLLACVLFTGIIICFAAALLKHEGGIASMGPAFSAEGHPAIQVLRILAMIPWAFVGFEAVVHSSSEFRFPAKRLFSLLIGAVIISSLMYLLLLLLPVLALPEGYSTWTDYIKALPELTGIRGMPVFSAAKAVLGPAGLTIIGCAMLSAQLTALFATFIAVSRLMRTMSENRMIPRWFGKCNRDGTPANAVLFVMLISFPMPFLGRTVISWPVDVSNLGAAVAYGYTSAAVFALARHKNGYRFLAQKAAGVFGIAMSFVFCVLMLVPNYLSGSSLASESYLLLALWCIVGFLLYRHIFQMDTLNRFGHSTVVWITVLIVIFFSTLMWFRLAVCHSAEHAFSNFIGKIVTMEEVIQSIEHTGADMLIKSTIELALLLSSLLIMLNLFSILSKREKNLIVEKLKAEESANKSKSYFFSTVSHDIRTPLNAIIGFSQMLKMGFDTEGEREQALDSILVSGKTLLRLINDVLDFSKLEDGSLVIEPKPTNCAKLQHEIVESCRTANATMPLDFRSKAAEMPPLMLDPQRIRQILYNLVSNAAKFTESGFVEVRSSFEKADATDFGTLTFEIEDTGCGIGEEDLKRIASPYVQVDSKRARHGGTGIGLAMCRLLIRAMGGDLSIASTLGKGSTFKVTLPNVKIGESIPDDGNAPTAKQAANDAKAKTDETTPHQNASEAKRQPVAPEANTSEAKPAEPTPDQNASEAKQQPVAPTSNKCEAKPAEPTPDQNASEAKQQPAVPAANATDEKPAKPAVLKRILIVDDQKMNLMVLKAMLNKLGKFEIIMAMNGKEALDILEASAEAPFDLVLTDMWMPTMDGEGLASAIHANTTLSRIPVYVVTADVEMQGKYKEKGFMGILLKPVTVEKLKAIMNLQSASEPSSNQAPA